MFQPDLDVLHRLTFEDNHRVSSWQYVMLFIYIFISNREHWASLMMDAEWLIMCKEADNKSREALRPADNMAWAVSHTVEWTKCRLYYFDCLLDIWFLTQFHSVIWQGQKLNVTQYSFFHLCNCVSSLVWGGYYRDGRVWHLPFSSYTAHHIWTTAASKLVCKPSDKLTQACVHNMSIWAERDLCGIQNILLGFGH